MPEALSEATRSNILANPAVVKGAPQSRCIHARYRIPHQQPGGGLLVAGKIALARLAAIGVTVWLMQRDAFFRRAPGDPPRFFAYVICGVIATAVAAGICLVFELGNGAPLSGLRQDLPAILLSGILCAVVAFCCDDWAEDTVPPVWLRFAEAAGCASVMGLGAIIIYFGDLLPFPANVWPHHWMLVAWMVLPSVMALFIGGCVPHIYRSARRAATARHEEAREAPAPAPSLASAPSTPGIPPSLVARLT